jgi:hypothetical protein
MQTFRKRVIVQFASNVQYSNVEWCRYKIWNATERKGVVQARFSPLLLAWKTPYQARSPQIEVMF